MMKYLVSTVAVLTSATAAFPLSEDGSNTLIKLYGAVGDGAHDDTNAFRQALSLVAAGGTVILPPGHYTLSDTIVITKPVTIIGQGYATQVFNGSGKTLFSFQGVNNASLRDVYLGSNSTDTGVSLIELVNSHHNQFNNVTMLGGYYGVHLKGSLLNTFLDLRSGTNFQGFFKPTSTNNTWVMAEPANGISSNANTFLAPALEGGANGIVISDGNGQGSVTITGGTIEGVSGVALAFNQTFLPSSVNGVHFEANGSADVIMNSSSNIRLSSIMSLTNVLLQGDSRNDVVEDSIVERMTIGPATKRIRVQNVTSCLNGADSGGIVNQNTGTSAYDGSPNVVFSQAGPAGNYCWGL